MKLIWCGSVQQSRWSCSTHVYFKFTKYELQTPTGSMQTQNRVFVYDNSIEKQCKFIVFGSGIHAKCKSTSYKPPGGLVRAEGKTQSASICQCDLLGLFWSSESDHHTDTQIYAQFTSTHPRLLPLKWWANRHLELWSFNWTGSNEREWRDQQFVLAYQTPPPNQPVQFILGNQDTGSRIQ